MEIEFKYFKLITGEEIVTACEDHGERYLFKIPAIVKKKELNENDKEPSTFIVLPYTANLKDHKIFMDKSKILYEGYPVDSLTLYYTSNFYNYLSKTNEN